MAQSVYKVIRNWRVYFVCFALLFTNASMVMAVSPSSNRPVGDGPGIVGTTQTTAIIPGHTSVVTDADNAAVDSPEQQQTRRALTEQYHNLPAPPMGPVGKMPRNVNPGPPTNLQPGPDAPTLQRDSVVPNAVGPMDTIAEPRTANAGKTVFQTGNWFAAASTNQGATWSGLNPTRVFGDSSWCCDQDTLYVPSRDRFFWLELFGASAGNANNHLAIANASSSNLGSWCFYNWFPDTFSLPSGTLQDFPKIAYANNYLYVTWNNYNVSGWFSTTLARIPLDAQASCSGVGATWLTRTDNFAYGLSTGSQEIFYWASAWFTDGTTNGANLRLFSWAENSGAYSWYNRAINTFTFGNVACPGPDSLNWCGRLDPRYDAVWISRADYRGYNDDWLGVALSAGPSGFTTHNYVVYEYFKLHDLSYQGNDQTYSTSYDFAYPSAAPNARGSAGINMAWGGGAYYPGNFFLIQDEATPSQPWDYSFYLFGQRGASGWGDYTGIQPWWPNGNNWIMTGWRVLSGGSVEMHNTVFGRDRDANEYLDWRFK